MTKYTVAAGTVTGIPPFLRLGNDLKEAIVELLLDEPPHDYYYHDKPFATAVRLSHVCSQLRSVLLSRRGFWTKINCSEDTLLGAVTAAFDRAGDMPLEIRMYTRTRGWQSDKRYPIDNPEVFEAVFQRMHRASSIDIQASNPTMTIFPDAAIIPVPYVERPLRKLHLRGCPLGDMLCLVGPQCIRIELVNLHSPNLRLRDLAEALRGAPALAHLIIEHNYFQDDAPGVVDETASRPLALQYLKLDDVSPMYKLLPLVFRLFSGTALSAPMVKVERSDLDLEEWSELCPQGFLQLLQLANLGVPKVIRVLNAGSEYDISFPNGIVRQFSLPTDFGTVADRDSVEIMQRLFSLIGTLEVHDVDTLFPDQWLKSWHGSTWSSIAHLELYIEYPEYSLDPEDIDNWISDASQRISLPRLQTLIIYAGRFYGQEEYWGAECAIMLDTFSFPDHVTINIRNKGSSGYRPLTEEDFKAAINEAYYIRYDRPYFPEVAEAAFDVEKETAAEV